MTKYERPITPELAHLMASGVVAVVRLNEAVSLRKAAEAVAAGGVGAFEVTLTTPGAVDAVRDLVAAKIPGLMIGAGTVLDVDATNAVIDAGARFVVSPTLELDVLKVCVDRNIICIPGAFSPSEALTAWRLGASIVKIYPSSSVGPSFISNVLGPLPFLRMSPSGGMTLENAADWIRAGAVAVSMAQALMDPVVIRNGDWNELTARAKRVVDSVAAARRERAGKQG